MSIKKQKTVCLIAFIIGTASLFFSGGHRNVPVTAFIWPAALLFCVRHINRKIFPAVLFCAMAAVNFVKLLGLSNSSTVVDFGESLLVTIVQFLPLLAEHFVCRRDKDGALWNSFARSLVFPAFYSGFSVLFCFTFISATGSVAYTLGGFSPAERITSVVGIFGLLFLLTWFASLFERLVSDLLSGSAIRIKKDAVVFLAVLTAVTAAGFLTTSFQSVDTGSTFRIAAAVGIEQPVDENGEYPVLPLDDSIASLKATMEEAKKQNAEVLVYNEEAYSIYDCDTDRLLNTACEKAKEYNMYVFLPLDISAAESGKLNENCIKLIDPEGNIVFTYEKSRLVPAIEEDYKKGDGNIPVFELTFSDGRKTKSAAFICYDGDSPLYINSIPSDVDVLISPSWDWKGIIEYHTPAMLFRSMENGAVLVKPTYDGISAISDCSGRTVHSFNSFETGYDHVEAADVPLKGIKTPYACLFSHVDFIYMILPVLICCLLFKKAEKQKKHSAKLN